MKQKKVPAIAVHAVVIKNNKILLLKRKNVWAKGCWQSPSGHLEYNETVEEGASRELKEETSLKCEHFNLLGIHTVKDGVHKPTGIKAKNYVYIYMKAQRVIGTAKINEPNKCEAIEWISIKDVKKLKLAPSSWYLINRIL